MRLTRKGFEAWLHTFDPSKVVGYAGSWTDCPLARFMGRPFISNKSDPKWAKQFVVKVDESKRGTKITASRALQILESIK